MVVDINHLRDDVKAMGKRYGFKVRTQGAQLVCSRANYNKARTKEMAPVTAVRQRRKASKIVGCCFCITYRTVENQRRRPRDAPEGSVYISHANFRHSNGCVPSVSQLIDVGQTVAIEPMASDTQDGGAVRETIQLLIDPTGPTQHEQEQSVLVATTPFEVDTESGIACINEIEDLMKRDFPVATRECSVKWWTDLNSLCRDLSEIGNLYDFAVRTQGTHLLCSRANDGNAKTAQLATRKLEVAEGKRRPRSSRIVGCGFCISYQKVANRKRLPKDAPLGSIYIARANYRHTNVCTPSRSQIAVSRAGIESVVQVPLVSVDAQATNLPASAEQVEPRMKPFS
jgi:hypothetical protein